MTIDYTDGAATRPSPTTRGHVYIKDSSSLRLTGSRPRPKSDRVQFMVRARNLGHRRVVAGHHRLHHDGDVARRRQGRTCDHRVRRRRACQRPCAEQTQLRRVHPRADAATYQADRTRSPSRHTDRRRHHEPRRGRRLGLATRHPRTRLREPGLGCGQSPPPWAGSTGVRSSRSGCASRCGLVVNHPGGSWFGAVSGRIV